MTLRSEFGAWSEDQAAGYLTQKNYQILAKNYRKPWGEIDIVAEKEGILIFVEVKANKEEIAGFEPELRVSPEKLRRLNRAIQTFLAYKKFPPEQEWQVDVVSLTLDKDRGVLKIKHFKNIDL